MVWILARGRWDSGGVWDDTDIWRDGPTLIQTGVEVIFPVFGPVSNAATWEERVTMFDTETGEPVDLTDLVDDIIVTIRDPYTGTEIMDLTLDEGEVFLLPSDEGGFGWTFTDEQMGTLAPKTYEVGVLFEQDEDVIQIILGRLTVLKGL